MAYLTHEQASLSTRLLKLEPQINLAQGQVAKDVCTIRKFPVFESVADLTDVENHPPSIVSTKFLCLIFSSLFSVGVISIKKKLSALSI